MNKAKIVILDGYTLNPGDLSWSELEQLGDVTYYDRTPNELILERAKGADIILTNKTPLTNETIEQISGHLRCIVVLATGYNVIDVEAAARFGIPVCNVPSYGTQSVAQFTIALLLALCHRVEKHHDAVQSGKWGENPDFCFQLTPQMELAGKVMGIKGFGRIGQQVARIALALGMQVATTSQNGLDDSEWKGVKRTTWDELLDISDVLSLHCPLTEETEGIINQHSLKKMKTSAFLLNTARGGLIVEQDLAQALNEGWISGAALDVLVQEPPKREQQQLLDAKNVIVTPHMAWLSKEARTRMMEYVVQNVKGYLEGKPVNVVNGV